MRIFGTLGAVDESTRSVEILASTPNPVDGEALVSWDLERFAKNPVILWSHDGSSLPIGRAENVRFDAAEGLKMRVYFATCEANPQAEHVYQSVRETTVRTVSVGFAPGRAESKTVDGKKVVERTANELLEVSFVSVPKDEDAGVISASQAASVLARSKSVVRTDSVGLEAGLVFRRDVGERLAKFERTATGGAVIPARVGRTGILRYIQPDGTVRREYRPPEEAFKADSLATLDRVPVIDFADHTALVTTENFSRVTRGNAETGKRDGDYVTSTLRVEDKATLDAIERGERSDISAGYVCRLDFTPGSFEGEPYDAVQRDIRYNHVALCPPNRGRAGPDVGLRLDSNEQRKQMKIIKLDGKDYEFGSEAHIEKLDAMKQAELAALQKRLDETEAEKDEAKDDARKAREEADATKKTADEERKKRDEEDAEKVREGTRIRRRAERILAAAREVESEDGDEDKKKKSDEDKTADDEKKMDSLSDREVMTLAIKAHRKDFDATGKSDDYVRARFDALEESVREKKKIGGVAATVHELQHRIDARDGATKPDIKAVEKAKAEQDQRARDAWKSNAKR